MPECNGVGRKMGVDLNKFLDKSKSLNEGAILFPEYAVDSWGWSLLINTGLFDNDKKLAEYTDEEMDAAAAQQAQQGQDQDRGEGFQPDL